MQSVMATGLKAFSEANARLSAAADRTVRAGAKDEAAPGRQGPTVRAANWIETLVEARIEMIRAHHQAAAAATSIRAASDQVGALLDVTA